MVKIAITLLVEMGVQSGERTVSKTGKRSVMELITEIQTPGCSSPGHYPLSLDTHFTHVLSYSALINVSPDLRSSLVILGAP